MKNLIRSLVFLACALTARAASTYVAGFPQGTATAGLPQALNGGAVTTSSPSYTTGQINPLSLTLAGALRTDASATTQPVSGTFWQATQPVSGTVSISGTLTDNVTQFGSVNISTGAGASGTGIPRVTVSNDSNVLTTQSGTWTVQPGNTANTTPWLVGGNVSNASSAVATGATNAPAIAYQYNFNGTTWDQEQDDAFKNLKAILPDQAITGQGSQTTLNNNIILATAGSGASAAANYRSISIEIVPSAGTVTAGNVTFQGSNDNVNFQSIYLYDQNAPQTAPVSTYALVAATNRFFKGPVQWQFVKAILSTGITGTTTGVQAFTDFSAAPFTPDQVQIGSSTAANANVTLGTGASTIGALTANQSVNLAQVSGTATVTGGVAGIMAIGGNIATGVAPTANPIPDGGITLLTLPGAAIANGLTERFNFTGDQQLIVHQDGDPSNEWMATSGTTALATTTQTALKAAGAAGVRNYCTGLQITNTSATVTTTVSIQDGSTVIWTGNFPATTAALAQVTYNVEFRTPLKGTAATAMNIVCGTTGAAVYYNVQGYQNN